MSTPQWMTSSVAIGPPHSRSKTARLSSEIVTVKAASATFWQSIVRSTWRSEPWAVNEYGIPTSRWTMKPASAGWVAKWQWTC